VPLFGTIGVAFGVIFVDRFTHDGREAAKQSIARQTCAGYPPLLVFPQVGAFVKSQSFFATFICVFWLRALLVRIRLSPSLRQGPLPLASQFYP
jgi:hypothetical protein